MKTKLFLLLVLVSGTTFSQVILDVPPKINSSYGYTSFNEDGSFDLNFGTIKYSYDNEGNLVEGPIEFKTESIEVEYGSYIYNRKTKEEYFFAPITSDVTRGSNEKGEHIGEIWIKNRNDNTHETEVIKFKEADLEISKKYIESDRDVSENRDRLKGFSNYAYIDDNDNPVFVKYGKGRSELDTKNTESLAKDKYYFYIKTYTLDLKSNSVNIELKFVDKISTLKEGKEPLLIDIIEHFEGKLFVYLEYNRGESKESRKADVWSIDDKTGEEKLEYTFDAYLGKNISDSDYSRTFSDSEDGSSYLIYNINYLRREKDEPQMPNSANYKVLTISSKLEYGITDVNIPVKLLKIGNHTSAPGLGCHIKNSNEAQFYISITERTQTDYLLIMNYENDEFVDYNVIKNANYGSAPLYLDDRIKEKADSLIKPIYDFDEKRCPSCTRYLESDFHFDINNGLRVVTIQYMRPTNCTTCNIMDLQVRLNIEQLPAK